MVAKKGSRLGVGAVSSTSASSSEANVSEDWTKNIKKQILSVGKKRSYVADYGDDDDAGGLDNGYNSSSDDEEEGRTTAVKERKKKKARQTDVTPVLTDGDAVVVEEAHPITDTVTTKSKKKKKKGKKERAQEQQPQAAQDVEDATATTTTPNDTEQNTTTTAVEPGNTGSNNNTKRKRKKVRSKQKNIAKDNRTANEKPSHLVLGRADYSGRPMTQTTKDKLGIKTKLKVKSNKAAKLDDAFESGEWVDEAGLKKEEDDKPKLKVAAASGPDGTNGFAPGWTARSSPLNQGDNNNDDTGEPMTKKQKKEEEGSLKKIGDCIVSMNNDDTGEPMTKKKKKSKKKKYKNV
ncbi:hypothetical protein ACHAWC_004983 [Mediolabrus comicus]